MKRLEQKSPQQPILQLEKVTIDLSALLICVIISTILSLEHGEDIADILLGLLNVEMVMQRKCYD